eukprot:1006030_1
MAAIARRGQPFMYPAPVVEHHPSEDAFTVSNVRNFADFEVNAPSLGYQIVAAGENAYRVEYMPTAHHPVELTVAGEEVASFTVSKNAAEAEEEIVNADPALLEDAPMMGVRHTVPGRQFMLLGMPDHDKLKIIAPGLQHSVFTTDAGVVVKYTPTGVHNVQIIYDGAEVDHFELMPKSMMRARADADEDDEK